MTVKPGRSPHTAASDDHGMPWFTISTFAVKDIGLGRRTARACNNVIRCGTGQGFKDHFRHKMAYLHSRCDRCRKLAVNNRTFRGCHFHRPDGTLVDRNIRVKG